MPFYDDSDDQSAESNIMRIKKEIRNLEIEEKRWKEANPGKSAPLFYARELSRLHSQLKYAYDTL